jgi:hypothetical protein
MNWLRSRYAGLTKKVHSNRLKPDARDEVKEDVSPEPHVAALRPKKVHPTAQIQIRRPR